MSNWCDLGRRYWTGDRYRGKKVLDQIGKKYGHLFHYTDILMGDAQLMQPEFL